MDKIYITVSFKGSSNKESVEYLCSLVKKAGFKDFCFIRDIEYFKQVFNNPKDLMLRALEEIKKCNYLLIDMSDRSTGRAIEAGIAYTLGKKVVVIMKKGTLIKSTTQGIADIVIDYDLLEDIVPKLKNYLQNAHS